MGAGACWAAIGLSLFSLAVTCVNLFVNARHRRSMRRVP